MSTETDRGCIDATTSMVRLIAWLLLAGIAVLTLAPPALRPQSGATRLVEHLVICAVAGGAFALGYRRRTLVLGAMAILLAGILELLQIFVPGRHARVSDFLIDASGACLGIVLAALRGRRNGSG